MVASPLICALRRWARFGAAGVVCGGGRRHGGRLGLGCIKQRVRSFFVLVLLFGLSLLLRCWFISLPVAS
jgi:hypothetical protein